MSIKNQKKGCPYKANASQLRQKLNKSNKIAHLISRWAILL